MAKINTSSIKGKADSASKSEGGVQPQKQESQGTPKGRDRTRNISILDSQDYKNKGNNGDKKPKKESKPQKKESKTRETKIKKSQDYKDRAKTGRLTEKKAYEYFKKKGYEVIKLHYSGNKGVDLGVVKRDKAGKVIEAAVIEVKGSKQNTPSKSHFKDQVRSSYYLPRLKKASNNSEAAKEFYSLATDEKFKMQSWAVTSGPQGDRLYKIPSRGKISSQYQPITL